MSRRYTARTVRGFSDAGDEFRGSVGDARAWATDIYETDNHATWIADEDSGLVLGAWGDVSVGEGDKIAIP